MKRILIIVAVLLTLLSGCANNTVQPPTETETVNDSTTDTFPQVEKETTSSQAVSQESSVNIDSLEESTQDTDESKTVQTEVSSTKQTAPDTKVEEKKSPSIKDETTSSQAETSSTSTKDQPKPTEAKPREQEKPKETGEACPNCGSMLVIRKGKRGEFTACSNYPKCKYIKKNKE